jgi:RNA polymerase sigma-70 factor, ECF subfamily
LQNKIDDRPIALRAKNGDAKAFRSLMELYHKRIIQLIYRMTHDLSLCDDLAQETFVRAYENLDVYDGKYPFYPWICRIAINLSLNYLRDRKPTVTFDEVLDTPEVIIDDVQALHNRELVKHLQLAIENLSPLLKATLILRIYEELSYKEIANVLNTTIGTVMSRLFRAREELKQQCSYLWEDES